MNTREYCCYTRPYSEIEGLQLAHTLLYSASAQPEGIVLELRVQQGGGNYTSRVVCPDGSFARVMRLMRYLCENGIGPGQWLDVSSRLPGKKRPPSQNTPYASTKSTSKRSAISAKPSCIFIFFLPPKNIAEPIITKNGKNTIFLKILRNLAAAAKQLEKMKPFREKFRKNERFYFFDKPIDKNKKVM